ncbi:MAG: ATP-binding protein, partial [Fusobacteriaceae bacterium]
GTTTKGSSESNSVSNSGNEGSSENSSKTITTGTNLGRNQSETNGKSETQVETKSCNKGENTSFEFVNKRVSEWNSYLDEILFKRVDYGKAKGLFNTSIFLCSDRKSTLTKLGNTMQSLFGGVNGNKVPLKLNFLKDSEKLEALKLLQFPCGYIEGIDHREQEVRIALSQFINNQTKKLYLGNWMSSNELSLIAGLPQKEVIGLSLKKEVEFGLNPNNKKMNDTDKVQLGKLVKSGNLTDFSVCLDRKHFDKHTFIAGVTGSGKTTTCQKILHESRVPFLVIEPAKTEYRILKNTYEDILVFTLGNERIAPFRMNPFEFFPHENITSRVDMIKVSIEAAFDMEAAIPQLIEAALYKCYEDYGWNISTNKNIKFENPFDDGVYSFPTLSDLLNNIACVATEQGFDERLKNDYIGSIKARLQSLLVGSKGLMLNTPRSIDFKDLLTRNVVLELEEIKSGSEKSLIMGFVMANLNEAIKASHYEARKRGEKFSHITLLEEAHRLLTKFEPGDNPSKKHGVETFADMLAEVRKYGESLIIVDQIPNKLTPEILKNTNTKIVHKLFAKDDKEAIGNTMALEDEQKDFLSYLDVGRAIVISQNFSKPVQVQIEPIIGMSTTET